MILHAIPEEGLPAVAIARRMREERVGGQAFDPRTGAVTELGEEELQSLRRAAANDDTLLYFATRSWAEELPEGCLSSPNRIYLEVTGRCNLSCAMCYRDTTAPEPELAADELRALIRRLASLGVHEIRFTGGEPTARPDLPELIDEALACCLYVSLGTNGVWGEGMAEELLARHIGRYLVSLDGPEEINDVLRGPGAFARTMETVDRLLASGRNLRVNTVITRPLLPVLPDFMRWLAGRGVRHLSLIAPRPVGRGAWGQFAADRPGATEMAAVSHLLGQRQGQTDLQVEFQYGADGGAVAGQASDPVIHKVRWCPAGREAAFVSPAGWMHACGCSPGGSPDPVARAPFAAGNVRHMSACQIHELWLQAEVWRVFRNLRLSKSPTCAGCARYGNGCFGSCPVHAYLARGDFAAADPLCPLQGC